MVTEHTTKHDERCELCYFKRRLAVRTMRFWNSFITHRLFKRRRRPFKKINGWSRNVVYCAAFESVVTSTVSISKLII